MIHREQLERWKALADAATPGPWEYLDLAGYPEVYPAPASYDQETVFSDTLQGADNARFTAAAREAVPVLLAEVEAQAKEIERLRAALTSAAAKPCELSVRGELWCASCIASLRAQGGHMRTAKEIATDVMLSIDDLRPPNRWCVERVAKAIRVARIEAVEEFRRRVFLELDEEEQAATEPDFRVRLAIAALPALPEEP